MGITYIRIAAICMVFLAAGCAERLGKNLIIVMPEEDGKVGAVTVSDGENEILLDKAYAAAKIGNDGQVETVSVTDADIDGIFGTAIDALPIPPKRFRLYFIEGSNQLTLASKEKIGDVLADINKRPVYDIEVTGHTDTIGQEEDNSELSLKRAYTIQNWLLQNGIEAETIKFYGRGEWDLLVKTEDNVDEPKNRRVEIMVR